MSRGSCTFRQRDVEAALRAARAAGFEVAGYTIDKNGNINVTIGKPAEQKPAAEASAADEWKGATL